MQYMCTHIQNRLFILELHCFESGNLGGDSGFIPSIRHELSEWMDQFA